MPIAFELNGRAVSIDVDPAARLLYVLRNRLEACGTRFGCGSGACGACFVRVDGVPAPACDTPMWAVEGKAVRSIEGLGTAEAPHQAAASARPTWRRDPVRLLRERHLDERGGAARPRAPIQTRKRSAKHSTAIYAAAGCSSAW